MSRLGNGRRANRSARPITSRRKKKKKKTVGGSVGPTNGRSKFGAESNTAVSSATQAKNGWVARLPVVVVVVVLVVLVMTPQAHTHTHTRARRRESSREPRELYSFLYIFLFCLFRVMNRPVQSQWSRRLRVPRAECISAYFISFYLAERSVGICIGWERVCRSGSRAGRDGSACKPRP